MSYLQAEIPINLIGFLPFLILNPRGGGRKGLLISPARANCIPVYKLITRIYLETLYLQGICHFL